MTKSNDNLLCMRTEHKTVHHNSLSQILLSKTFVNWMEIEEIYSEKSSKNPSNEVIIVRCFCTHLNGLIKTFLIPHAFMKPSKNNINSSLQSTMI
ncbi:CLUMA_CG018562, isoform A [Clunio marinus]|uniref:CLUMA_CG018562, isoform A n=1 Tax=Clunio marinus TaxID=568069 RepID=A0A1J1J1I1_9DIPT|nr:CLUMA_CG018562, isoform A [Clunio marinus]